MARAAGVVIRRYREEDAEQLVHFKCRTHGQKWTVRAERNIRDAPALVGDEVTIFVAVEVDSGGIVGAIVFGPSDYKSTDQVLSLGVVVSRRRQYIGSDLKLAVMADCAARGVHFLASQVHKHNYQMRRLNDSLGVETSIWTEDEYHFTGVRVKGYLPRRGIPPHLRPA